MFGSLRRAARPAATAASPDLEDAKPPPPPRRRRRRLRARLLAPAALAALAVVVGADGPTSSILLLFAALSAAGGPILGALYLVRIVETPVLLYTATHTTSRLVAATPSLHSPLSHTLWLSAFALVPGGLHAHAQVFAQNQLKKRHKGETGWFLRQILTHADGGTTALEWLRFAGGYGSLAADAPPLPDRAPLLLVLHAILAGDYDQYGLSAFVRAARLRGWRVVLHARRGHGDLPFTTPRWNTVGNTSDARDALRAVRARHPAAAALCIAGFSAGSGLMMRFLGELGDAGPQFARAAVAVSPGYALPDAWTRVRWPYNGLLAKKCAWHFLERHREAYAAGAAVDAEIAAAAAAPDLLGFHAAAHRLAGFASAAEMHAASDPVAVAPAVRVPTLLLTALDDPFCVSQNVDDHRGLVLANPSLVLATTRRGGHLAFYEGLMAKPWAERVALEWLGAALEVVPGAASVPLS